MNSFLFKLLFISVFLIFSIITTTTTKAASLSSGTGTTSIVPIPKSKINQQTDKDPCENMKMDAGHLPKGCIFYCDPFSGLEDGYHMQLYCSDLLIQKHNEEKRRRANKDNLTTAGQSTENFGSNTKS